jgi:hypothetical protein
MDHTTEDNMHLCIAAAALAASGACLPPRLSADQLLLVLSDLASIAGLLGEFATRTRRQLAAWATVGAHLDQAEQHAADLRRSLNHAGATLAFSSHPPTAA